METTDYSKLTSTIYDDRAGDTITRLDVSLIKVCEGTSPKMAFFLTQTATVVDGVPTINLNIESYVKLSALPPSVRQYVNEIIDQK